MKTKNNPLWLVLLVVAFAAITAGLVFVANKPSKSSTADKSAVQAKNGMQVFTKLAKAKKFDAAKVKELKVEELKAGDGDVVAETDTIKANYTGWNAEGVIFDSTKKSADAPLTPIEFPLTGVIPGWTKGLAGKKVGGIYKLTMPADMAYGSQAPSAETSGPLEFVVEILSKK
ncbi:MAG: FKBP-type peptidyl-prolyl cis-trans isomerase [Pseudolactococcus laudensis]|uniref:Peptidyl-prolyl cis-trans isomerase n=1 Tax=Pseudolactococcus laudensis TaxID=1494461 RepID=A0A7V8N058_9LACT|nr:FKBP-type peptidyl-prolyl cis-trans isomerase [Lactococcus laudensis]MBA0016279.1 FKBP-type peptidyl-prolyl cis-trans isomerase [Lactococcus laudensis]